MQAITTHQLATGTGQGSGCLVPMRQPRVAGVGWMRRSRTGARQAGTAGVKPRPYAGERLAGHDLDGLDGRYL